jgi:hypothetical protein
VFWRTREEGETLKKIVVPPNRPRIAVKGQEISICGQEQNSQEAIVKKSQFVVKNKKVKKMYTYENIHSRSRTKQPRRCSIEVDLRSRYV